MLEADCIRIILYCHIEILIHAHFSCKQTRRGARAHRAYRSITGDHRTGVSVICNHGLLDCDTYCHRYYQYRFVCPHYY
jgi:hypothetical protein